MLENLTIIFPLAVALGVLLWFCRWVGIHKQTALTPEGEPETPPDGRFDKKDWLCLGILTVVYAIVAFWGLGQNSAPQSFLHYTEGNQYALIELNEAQPISRIQYYTGLGTADYSLQFSTDGETWIEQLDADGNSGMPQNYSVLFRWNDATLNGDLSPIRYIRIISGTEQYLGEIALYDADGQLLIAGQDYTVASGCEALVDEQDVVPEKYNYKNGTYFDEIYFPRTAYEMIQGMWPYEITHPPLGKAILSLGIRIFGMTPFGWRFMGVLFGILMLPVLYVFLKKMFKYTAVALGGTTIFAFDFMHYTQTRLATIDTYAVFFILLQYLFMYLWLTEPPENRRKRLLWLGLSGLNFGLGAASKWVGIYAGAGLALIWLTYWVVRCAREKKAVIQPLCRNILWCLLFFVFVPAVVYYLSYYSYGPSQGADGVFRIFTKKYLQIVIDNQKYMWNYHSGLEATHPYSSVWYQWLLDIRPILYYLEYFGDGTKSAFGAFSNPLVCWGGLLAMGGMGWLAIRDHDERAIFILLGYVANLLPWVLISRLTFAYHYFPCTVFLVLALARIFQELRQKDWRWPLSVGGFTAATVGLFIMFYPVLSGMRVSMDYTTHFLKWFTDTWPF
jgi:4-amino-4-deoxy-L-arabinose transferase-like glycosyltransferase